MSNPNYSKRSNGSLKPYSALRGVNSSKTELPKDDERTTMITDAIMNDAFDMSQLRHKDDCESVQTHRPMYADWVEKVKNEQGKEELDSNAVTQLRKTLHDTVAANFVGPATQARSLSSLIFTSYEDKQTSLPVNCHIGDSPAPNQWPPRSAEFFAAMSCKYRLTLATMTDAQRVSVANEIQATCTDFVGNPESTMRELGVGSRALSTTSTSPCSGCEWASPKCSSQYSDPKSESSNQSYGPEISIVDGYTRSQSLVLAINDPEADISCLSESDQVVVQSCWKEWALPDEIGTGRSLRERSESALALLQAACLRKTGQNRTLPDSLLPWVEVVGTDHMWRLLNCQKGSEAGVMKRTEVLCSRIVGSVL